MLIDIPALVSAYYTGVPDITVPDQRIAFGTSGHRGSSLRNSFNEIHILAITQAICEYRKDSGIDGPLFIGMDTHALSTPAQGTALEVLAANGVDVMIASGTPYTPTPAVSLAILQYNAGRSSLRSGGLADGIIITPSHNPPEDGGFKYNPPNGGPAEQVITKRVEDRANELLKDISKIRRLPYAAALKAAHPYDYVTAYVNDLANVLDMDAIASSTIKLAVDPLGGAGVHYWGPIAEKYKLKNLTILNSTVDPTFRFMTLDHDGKIRMDPSSPFAMKSLIDHREHFDITFACDTDHDRHGIVTRGAGLLPPNHYLCVCIDYLFGNRPGWGANAAVGKTIVSSSLIDRVAAKVGRRVHEVPVGFKWFVDGLLDGSLGFVGEESAGAAFLRRNGGVWTTDKDGFIPSLLSAEIMAKTGRDPGEIYVSLTRALGDPVYDRVDAPATPEQKKRLSGLSPSAIDSTSLAGEKIVSMQTTAPGNGAAIGGLKVSTENGWFAARPSGTENIYKIYGESFKDAAHLQSIFSEAQSIVDKAISK